MSSIYNYKKEIMKSNPKHQVIELSLHPKKWENLFKQYPIVKDVLEDLSIQNGKYCITRDDVFHTKGKHRIVKALVWASADNPKVNNVRKVLDNLDDIYKIMSVNEGKNLAETDFRVLCDKLDDFAGVGSVTYSILLYFYNVKCDDNDAVAVTSHIKPKFKKFDELKGLEDKGYIEQIIKINEIARNLSVPADWVEYFLYRVDKGEVKL